MNAIRVELDSLGPVKGPQRQALGSAGYIPVVALPMIVGQASSLVELP
jgi:hypothetical protein